MKKAQITSQIFIYVFALLVISLILFFGIKAISDFKNQTERIEYVKFREDMKDIVSSVASEFDSVKEVKLSLPKDFRYVCFSDKDTTDVSISSKYPNMFPLIEDEFSGSGTTDNVFLVKESLEYQFQTTRLDIKNSDFLCIKNENGEISFILRGKSKYAEISE